MITHQPALVRFLLQQNFLRVQNGMICVRNSCDLSMYSQYNGCSQETNISVSSSPDGCYIRLWTPLNPCVLWTDVAAFTRSGVCILHTWVGQNPHAARYGSRYTSTSAILQVVSSVSCVILEPLYYCLLKMSPVDCM